MDKRQSMGYEGRTSALARAAFRCVLALALCLALAAGFLPSARAEGGSCEINVVFPSQLENDAVLNLYNVGVWLDDGGTSNIHLLSQYKDVVFWDGMTASERQKAADTLLDLASKETPTQAKTVAKGQAKATFTVEPGAYLISGPDSLGFETLLLIVSAGEDVNVNAKVTEVVTAEVQKIWDTSAAEYDIPDLQLPDSITVTLYYAYADVDYAVYTDSNGEAVRAELKEASDPDEKSWYASVSGLPKFKADGGVVAFIQYEWREDEIPGYVSSSVTTTKTQNSEAESGSANETNDGKNLVYSTEITNTLVTVSAKVRKEWKDNGNASRPEEIVVSLVEGENTIADVTLKEANNWQEQITGLPKYRGADLINYHWVEKNVPKGYTVSFDDNNDETDDDAYAMDVTIVNTLSETVNATVKKVWKDGNNQDGDRPKTLNVTLKRSIDGKEDAEFSQTVTLKPNDKDEWPSATIEGLVKYNDEGVEYEYTWQEEDLPEGYELTSIVTEGTVTTLTNTCEPETTEVTIIKIWEDDENLHGLRPPEIKVALSNGEEICDYAILNKDNKWQETIGGLPKYRNSGEEITYTWVYETDKQGLLKEHYYPGKFVRKEGDTITYLTNVLVPQTRIPVVKYWQDGRTDAERPPITIQVMNGSKVVASKTLYHAPWEYVFENLDTYDKDGHEIEYTVKEIVPDGYTAAITSVDTTVAGKTVTTYYITNTPIHTPPEYNNYDGVKVWNDGGNAAGIRPAYITVHLLRDGVEVASATVTAATNWQYHFDNMPVDDGYGHIYNYTVVEDSVPGYYTVVKGSTIINGIIPDEPKPPKTEEELEKVVDLFNHDTPLFDRPLGTGDVLPIYPFVFAGIGLAAVVLLLVLGRRRRRS